MDSIIEPAYACRHIGILANWAPQDTRADLSASTHPAIRSPGPVNHHTGPA